MQRNKQQEEIFGFIAALRTILDNYPELQRNENLLTLLNSNSPIGFLLNLAEICGLSKTDLLNWLSNILCGAEALVGYKVGKLQENVNNNLDNKEKSGVLDIIEEAVRIILLTNIKNLFTCSLNPFIPTDVLKHPLSNFNNDVDLMMTKGITLSIPTIDVFNVLMHSPNDNYGKTLYFDNNMSSNEYWKSTDFNVFLWYVINKGTNINNENLKNIWDNRVRHRKNLKINENFRKNFFDIYKGESTYIDTLNEIPSNGKFSRNEKDKKREKKDENIILKKQILLIEYNEQHPSVTVPNTITVWINADRYRKQIKTKNNYPVYINKTVFEFNYDYIYSLKLFDSKTIVSNIINSILGISKGVTASIVNGKYSIEQDVIAGKVSEIVTKVMNDEDTVIDDCFFSFSNEEYENLLNQTELKYNNNYNFGDVYGKIDEQLTNDIINNINNISTTSTLNEQQTIIQNLFTGVASATAAKNGEVSIRDKFTFGENIIFDIIKESVTQIVLQVLSPKVMILYALNSYFMGDVADGDFSKININNLLKSLTNLIVSIVKQVLNIIINELLKYLLTELKKLLDEIMRKLILERVEYYLEIIKRLYALVEMFYRNINGGPKSDTFIDNVNYPDIVPVQKKPKETTC